MLGAGGAALAVSLVQGLRARSTEDEYFDICALSGIPRTEDLVFRPVGDYCDIAEVCDGITTMCPADVRRTGCVVPDPDPDGGPGGGTTFTRPSQDLSSGCEAAGASHSNERWSLAVGLAALGLVLALRRRADR